MEALNTRVPVVTAGIIDAHVHFWDYDPVRDAWINEDMAVIRKSFSPADAKKEFDANGVVGCVAVQADQSVQETQYLLALARENPFIRGVVGWIDVLDHTLEEQLQRYAGEPLLKGFRHIIQGADDEQYFHHKRFQQGMHQLSTWNFTYDLLIYHDQLPEAVRFTERYPDQHFILDHLAKPAIRDKQWKAWKEGIRLLAQHPHMYCKLSGMITEADWNRWRYEDLAPYLEIVAEYFGIHRLCFGSDWPVALVAGSYDKVIGVLHRFLQQVSAEDREKVMGGNTKTFYKLD